MIIALTGNIGSGKSAAAEIFKKSGFIVINADKIGHELYKRKEIKNKVVKKFGKKILTKGKIDRKKLKNIVFYNHKQLIALNKIVHPEIVKELNKKTKNKVVIEGALIIEAKFKNYDKLILITINKKQQITRLLKKGKYTKEEINNIINSQLSQEKKLKYADYIVDNSGSKKELEKNINNLIHSSLQK